MKNLIIILLILVLGASCKSNTNSPDKPDNDGKDVLICMSDDAYAYHKYRCRGLSQCESEVITISLEDAQNTGRTPCKNCYR